MFNFSWEQKSHIIEYVNNRDIIRLCSLRTLLVLLQVNYFIGRKAIDAIMESKLKDKLEIHTRQQACFLMEEMLTYKFFHRASKVAMEVKPKKNKVCR